MMFRFAKAEIDPQILSVPLKRPVQSAKVMGSRPAKTSLRSAGSTRGGGRPPSRASAAKKRQLERVKLLIVPFNNYLNAGVLICLFSI